MPRKGQIKDLIGYESGDFIADRFDDTCGKYEYRWICRCKNCGYEKSIATNYLTRSKDIRCEECNKSFGVPRNIKGYKNDLTGKKYGRLTVLSYSHKEHSHSHWLCKCDCGEDVVKSISYLNKSKYLMCDQCMHSYTKKDKKVKEKSYIPFENIAYQTKDNSINVKGEFAIVNDKIIMDKADLEEILKYKRYISISSGGYPYINWKGRELFLHRHFVGLPQEFDKETQLISEHINGNRLDCRRENLRICHKTKNAINCKIYKTNKSGHKGISWNPKLNKWQVNLQYNKKNHYLGVYSNIEDAIKVRKEAEEKYYGDFNRREEDLMNGKI